MRKALYFTACVIFLGLSVPVHASKNRSMHLPNRDFTSPDITSQPSSGLFTLFFKIPNQPVGGVKIDERMSEAIRIAEKSARSRSIKRCWRYVKRALQLANVIDCYPTTRLAKQAAVELPERYGFKQIPVENPLEAPVGSVLVYGGQGAGHVEIRTPKGFVSDFSSSEPSPRPLIGVFVKPSDNTGL